MSMELTDEVQNAGKQLDNVLVTIQTIQHYSVDGLLWLQEKTQSISSQLHYQVVRMCSSSNDPQQSLAIQKSFTLHQSVPTFVSIAVNDGCENDNSVISTTLQDDSVHSQDMYSQQPALMDNMLPDEAQQASWISGPADSNSIAPTLDKVIDDIDTTLVNDKTCAETDNVNITEPVTDSNQTLIVSEQLTKQLTTESPCPVDDQQTEMTSQPSNKARSEDLLYNCVLCSASFKFSSKLEAHIRKHRGDRAFKCKYCGKGFFSSTDRNSHERNQHVNVNRYQCPVCKKFFKSHSYMKKHEEQQHNTAHICNYCQQEFASSGELKAHRKTHKGDERPFACGQCHATFHDKSGLVTHMKVHSEERNFFCRFCNKGFKSRGECRLHERIHASHKPYQCIICDKKFLLESYLKSHMLRHRNDGPCVCGLCGKQFARLDRLKVHEKMHSGEAYPCLVCGKSFQMKMYLRKHMRSSHGDKVYQCSHCDKSFSQARILQAHERTHTGLKPYVCTECGTRFAQRCSLRTHRRIHTGEKPYRCETCGEQFRHLATFNQHKARHALPAPLPPAPISQPVTEHLQLIDQSIHIPIQQYQQPVQAQLVSAPQPGSTQLLATQAPPQSQPPPQSLNMGFKYI